MNKNKQLNEFFVLEVLSEITELKKKMSYEIFDIVVQKRFCYYTCEVFFLQNFFCNLSRKYWCSTSIMVEHL